MTDMNFAAIYFTQCKLIHIVEYNLNFSDDDD